MYILYLKFLITMAEFRLVLFFFNDKQFSFLYEVVNWFFIAYSLSKAFFLKFVCENLLSSTSSMLCFFLGREKGKKSLQNEWWDFFGWGF